MAGLTGRMMDRTKDYLSSHKLQRFMPFMGNLQARTPSYQKVGEQFLGMFIELGSLGPGDRVLDIGCGPGRMAVPLKDYLSAEGSYVGMDVVRSCIRGCEKRLAGCAPEFRFEHMDVYNSRYNPGGATHASGYRFPFDDSSFDFIMLTSVFTHMLTDDTFHYLDEISRLLAPGGRCFATFFIADEERLARARSSGAGLTFPHASDRCMIERDGQPEYAVAYAKELLLEQFVRSGLELKEIHRGNWCGGESSTGFQDIAVLLK
jgi:ubiquinone/menaquinone biosynthesis C-methylase UbiE